MEAVNLNRFAYFAAVVDTGSFTAAAERLGITKAVVSQQVSRLEADLKTTLLLRTTRRVVPTEAGRLFHARCAMILGEAENAVQEIAQINATPTGVLRISAPNDYGARVIAPVAAGFARRYPACRINLMLSDAKTDLLADQIDLSIRVGWLTDSSFQARKIGTFRQCLVASPALAGAMVTASPQDLEDRPFIANGAFRDPLAWHFSRDDFNRHTVHMREAMWMDSTPAILEATLAGGGMSVLPEFMVTDHVQRGQLVQLLPEWKLPAGGVHAVYPAARFRPIKVTAFVSMLVDYVRGSSDM